MNLKPCPFCGGTRSEIREDKHWTGTDYIVIKVDLLHWCDYPEDLYQYTIKITGKSKEAVAERWNNRYETIWYRC